MASNVTLVQDNHAFVPATLSLHQCAYCHSSIQSSERWVREKIYELSTVDALRYCRYHADLFPGEESSCWEKHQIQQETARAAKSRAHA